MSDNELQELVALLSSPQVGERLRGMDQISAKAGGAVIRVLNDRRVVPLLLEGLGDSNRRVQRAAARGLRAWASDPTVFDSALSAYATDCFDGTYSHVGLYDTRSGVIWIPRYAGMKGHAALLRDGNTDRYLRFEFYMPRQAPRWIPEPHGSGHLLLYFIPEWSYSRQQLIQEFDERRARANVREQERYGSRVEEFYTLARLPYAVRVHRIFGGGGHQRRREFDVSSIRPVSQR